MTDCCDPTDQDLETELARARRALEVEHDPLHCRHHLAAALYFGPNDPRTFALYQQWHVAADAALLAQSADPPKPWIGDALLAAQLAYSNGAFALAVLRVLDALAAGARPETSLWLDTWCGEPSVRAVLDPVAIARHLHKISNATAANTVELCARLDDWIDRLQPPLHWTGAAIVVRVRLKRRAERLNDALVLSNELEQEQASYYSAIAVASCHRDLGDVPGAIAAFRLAAERAPEDGLVWLDIGSLALEASMLDTAIDAFEKAVGLGGKLEISVPSLAACRYLRQPSPATWLQFNSALAPGIEPQLERYLRWLTEAWVRRIPEPTEGCIAVLPRLQGRVGEVKVRAPTVEAPCAQFFAWRTLTKQGAQLHMLFEVEPPDPRNGVLQLAALVFEHNRVWPRYPRPAAELATFVATLAQTAFTPTGWLQQARQLQLAAQRSARELIACVPWPAPPPPDVAAATWFRQHVTACVFLIGAQAQAASADLWDIVQAPIDWTGEAALLCLAALALLSPDQIPHFLQRCVALYHRVPMKGDCALANGMRGVELLMAEHGHSLPAPRWWDCKS